MTNLSSSARQPESYFSSYLQFGKKRTIRLGTPRRRTSFQEDQIGSTSCSRTESSTKAIGLERGSKCHRRRSAVPEVDKKASRGSEGGKDLTKDKTNSDDRGERLSTTSRESDFEKMRARKEEEKKGTTQLGAEKEITAEFPFPKAVRRATERNRKKQNNKDK